MAWTELRERSGERGGEMHRMKELLKEIKENLMELCEMVEDYGERGGDYGERDDYGERGDAWRIERERRGGGRRRY